MYRKTYALINKETLKNNVSEVKRKYPNYEYYFGVVKNNAYGHGDTVVSALLEGGINYLAVSSLDEAMNIRKFAKKIPILILEPISLEFIDVAVKNDITITVDNLEYVKSLTKLKLNQTLKVHFKIDSGMNRLGFKNRNDIKTSYELITKKENIFLEGIYTHFATSGRGDNYYDFQVNNVYNLIEDIDLDTIPIIHFDRSLTFVSHNKLKNVNGVRLGIVMYGFSGSVNPDTSFKGKLRKLKKSLSGIKTSPYISVNNLNLKTAFSLYSSVISVRKVCMGEHVGYNATYVAPSDGYIATIAIGYADGVTKDFKYVYINNRKYEIVSDSMDMIMVFVDSNVKIGDKVEIFGDHIKIKEVTRLLNTNSYHLFNMITSRVPRIYEEP